LILIFVVVIIRYDKANGQFRRKMYVLLGSERGGKYQKYKYDVQPNISSTRKFDYPFKLRDKIVSNGEANVWIS